MAGQIPRNFIDDLLAQTDIVDLVNERVKLKKQGKDYYACCPFHAEKSSSFTVSRLKQMYYCFGCGSHGDAIGFLMAMDNLSFPEAVEELAIVRGLEVPSYQPDRGIGLKEKSCMTLWKKPSSFTRKSLFIQDIRLPAVTLRKGELMRPHGSGLRLASPLTAGTHS